MATRRYIDEWDDLVSLNDEVARFRNNYNIAKTECEITSGYRSTWDWESVPAAFDDLMAFPGVEKVLGGAEIRDIFVRLMNLQMYGTAQKFLTRVVTKKPWREAITAEDIQPLFKALTLARDYTAREMALAYLFTTTAQYPQWLTGEEAHYLPQTLKYLSETRRLPFRNSRGQPEVAPDWKRIKILLRRAIGFAPWREAIPPEVLEDMATQRGDNYMKNLGLPAIWRRLSALRPEAKQAASSGAPQSPDLA